MPQRLFQLPFRSTVRDLHTRKKKKQKGGGEVREGDWGTGGVVDRLAKRLFLFFCFKLVYWLYLGKHFNFQKEPKSATRL